MIATIARRTGMRRLAQLLAVVPAFGWLSNRVSRLRLLRLPSPRAAPRGLRPES
jgi:hypothetical protein